MNKKRLFKEIEVNVADVGGRPALLFDDIDKICYDLCFTKSKLDIHTLRVLKTLFASIRLTYKALAENEQLDVNNDTATIYLSRKKVKKLVKKSLKISKKDQSVEDSDLDELENYLAPEEPSLNVSKEEAIELIHTSIDSSLEPYLDVLNDVKDRIKESPVNQPKKPTKAAKKEKKDKPTQPEQPDTIDENVDDDIADVDFAGLEEE